MLLCIRYFFEKSNDDYEKYKTIWDENNNRMIFLETDWSNSKQLSELLQNISDSKDILAIRFPNKKDVCKNEILSRLQNGEGIMYKDTIWFPNEIWIYNSI